jgi:methylase of polypeptide subunit release factors
MQHQICKMTLHGRLHLAPLKEADLKHVLDFGTGTGIWAIEFGKTASIILVEILTCPSPAIPKSPGDWQ